MIFKFVTSDDFNFKSLHILHDIYKTDVIHFKNSNYTAKCMIHYIFLQNDVSTNKIIPKIKYLNRIQIFENVLVLL